MTYKDKEIQDNLGEIDFSPSQPDSIELILQLFKRDIERHYGGRTVGETLTGEEAKQRLEDIITQATQLARLEELNNIEDAYDGPEYTDAYPETLACNWIYNRIKVLMAEGE